jgi:hypothetical protein
MYEEVLLVLDQVQDINVQVPERLHHIVPFRVTQASRVEETSHGVKIRDFMLVEEVALTKNRLVASMAASSVPFKPSPDAPG